MRLAYMPGEEVRLAIAPVKRAYLRFWRWLRSIRFARPDLERLWPWALMLVGTSPPASLVSSAVMLRGAPRTGSARIRERARIWRRIVSNLEHRCKDGQR